MGSWIQMKFMCPVELSDKSFCCGSTVMNLTGIHEDVGLNPGPAQWVRHSTLPRAAVQVTDTAQIWRCCGCGISC